MKVFDLQFCKLLESHPMRYPRFPLGIGGIFILSSGVLLGRDLSIFVDATSSPVATPNAGGAAEGSNEHAAMTWKCGWKGHRGQRIPEVIPRRTLGIRRITPLQARIQIGPIHHLEVPSATRNEQPTRSARDRSLPARAEHGHNVPFVFFNRLHVLPILGLSNKP